MPKQHGERFVRLVDEGRAQVTECDVHAVKRRLDAGERFHLVDVREADEVARGRLPTAVHLSKGVIERDVEQAIPDPDAPIVLYCGGGYRSVLAACNLRRMGYTDACVTHLPAAAITTC